MKEHIPSLYLTELVLNLLVFLICAVICCGLLLRAWGMNRDSGELTRAVALAQTAAETLRGGGTQNGAYTEDGLIISYVCTGNGEIVTAKIQISSGDRMVYSLTAAWPEGGGT